VAKKFTGRTVGNPTENQRLNANRQPKFLFMWHPEHWDIIETADGYELLPMLTKFQFIPGLNGVKHLEGGGIDTTAARASFMDQGWVFISNETVEDGGYLRKFDGRNGSIYVDKWSTPRLMGHGGRARVIWETDKDGFNEYRRSLLFNGIIPQPDPAALDWKIELLEKRSARKVKNSHIPKVAKDIEKIEEKKEAVKAAKATKKTTAPKRRRTRKKAGEA